MFFNSIIFAIFLPIVFSLYWVTAKKGVPVQNVILLLASYVFYGWWGYGFLFLLAFSTSPDYFSGLRICSAKSFRTKKIWLFLSVFINIGLLCFFKYFNFLAGSLAALFGSINDQPHAWALNIILPVGISFYTFHGLSYVYDVYYQRCKPTRNFVDYSLFVSFFPLLVAGPIERAKHLLPQIQLSRNFEYSRAADGMRQILWGLFKKIVVADNCAHDVNIIFSQPGDYRGSTLLYGALLFTFQIYCDFSGYSDIAIGTARLFGFDLVRNFSYPYFSRNIPEFWRRWNISVSTWFRDYFYASIGGRYGTWWQQTRNIMLMFILIGFWHGANWTFLTLGLVNGLLFLPALISKKHKKPDIAATTGIFPSLTEAIQILTTFFLITMGCVLFRSATMQQALEYFRGIFSMSLFSGPQMFNNTIFKAILIMLVVEWLQRYKQHGLQIEWIRYKAIRWGIYIALIYFVCYFGGTQQEYIYFKF